MRHVIPPFSWRESPIPTRMNAAFVPPYRRARRTMRLGRDAGDLGHAGGRVRREVRAQRVEARGRPGDVRVVQEVLGHQDVHQPEGQRPVGPRADHQVLVGLLRRAGPVGVDADDVGPARPGLLHERHHVDVRVGGVDPPQQDQVGVHHLLGVVAGDHADGGLPAGVGRRRADGPVELARAERVEEGVAGVVLDAPERPRVRERQDRLRPPLGQDPGEAMGDLLDRLVPGDALELAGALRGRRGAAGAGRGAASTRGRRSRGPSRR